jgi:hypothetical protein
MTAVNRFKMPFLMSADRAALIIQGGLERRRGRIAFPWPMHVAARLAASLPSALMDRLAENMPKK